MEISQTPKVDMRTTQSFGIGKVKSPNYLWSSLRAVRESEMVRNGVLIIFSGEIGGRIGIFCNRYVSGAVIDREDLSGLEALRLLLAIKTGMFAFRPCLASEGAELKQDLAIDIDEILDARTTAGVTAETPAEVIGGAPPMAGEPKMESIAIADGETNMSELADSLGTGGLFYTPVTTVNVFKPPTSPEKVTEDFAPESALKPAMLIPEIEGPDPTVTTGSFDLNKYRDLIEKESEKIADRLKQASGDAEIHVTSKKEIMEDLRLFGEMLKAEGNRVEGWLKEDLDAIARPRAAGKSAAGGRSQFAAECEDLVSESLLAKFKDVQAAAQAVPPPAPAPKPSYWSTHPKTTKTAAVVAACAALFGGSQLFTAGQTDALIDNAKRSMAGGRPQEAVVYLDDAVRRSPGSARAYFYRGLAYQALNDPNKALPDLNKASSLGEPKSVLLPARAAVETSLQTFDKAIEDCTNAIVDNPSSGEAYRLRAVCHSRQENYGQAIEDCDTALKYVGSDKSKARVLSERGYAKAKHGDRAGAMADFTESLRLRPYQWTYLRRADAYRAAGKLAEAAEDYSQVLRTEPNAYFALVGRGICQAKRNHREEAMRDFNQAARVNRSGVEALIQRGKLELADQQWQSAADDLQRATKLNPNVPEARQQLALALQHLQTTLRP